MQWALVTQTIQDKTLDKTMVRQLHMMEVQYLPIKQLLNTPGSFDEEALALEFKKFLGDVWKATVHQPAPPPAAAAQEEQEASAAAA